MKKVISSIPSIDNNNHVNIILNWASIRHNRLFEHIIALGSRIDLLLTANSILIAGFLILHFVSPKSDDFRLKIGFLISLLCLLLLGLSFLLCIISLFPQVKHKKGQPPFFSNIPQNLCEFVTEIDRYANKAGRSINLRHILLVSSASMLFLGVILFGFIVIKCLLL